MTQQRDAPAFQEYAASMMARTPYRVMSLAGRGLLYTMRLECWVNGSMPSDPAVLARVLGYGVDEVALALGEVAPFFSIDGGAYRCPELDNYRNHLEDRRARQSKGGKVGAAMTNKAHQNVTTGKPASTPQARRESLVKPSTVKTSQFKSIEGKGVPDPEFVAGLEGRAYERASRGS